MQEHQSHVSVKYMSEDVQKLLAAKEFLLPAGHFKMSQHQLWALSEFTDIDNLAKHG